MTSRFKRLTTAIFGATFALLLGAVAAANPLVGTWHLNVAKSKFRTSPPPKSAIARVTTSKDGEISVHPFDCQRQRQEGRISIHRQL